MRRAGFWHSANGALVLVVGGMVVCKLVIVTAMLIVSPARHTWPITSSADALQHSVAVLQRAALLVPTAPLLGSLT